MTPFFFGDSSKQLYGVYHPPASQTYRDEAILICYPIGEEYIRTHRVLTQLTGRLTGLGFHVLRFDYYGSGNSAGSTGDGDVTQWVQDIKTALTELKDMSAVSRLSVIGIRFGAALAALASSETRINKLVLWDPVTDGKAYVQGMKKMQQALLEQHRHRINRSTEQMPHSPNEYFGIVFPDPVLQSRSGLDLKNSQILANKISLTVSEEKPGYTSLLETMQKNNLPVEYNYIQNEDVWDNIESLKLALISPALLQSIATFLDSGA